MSDHADEVHEVVLAELTFTYQQNPNALAVDYAADIIRKLARDWPEAVNGTGYVEDVKTYHITRFRDGENEIRETGLTLEEAQAHCRREDTHGDGWFDGYDQD